MKPEKNSLHNTAPYHGSMEVMACREAALLRYYQLSQSGCFPIMYEERDGTYRVGLANDDGCFAA